MKEEKDKDQQRAFNWTYKSYNLENIFIVSSKNRYNLNMRFVKLMGRSSLNYILLLLIQSSDRFVLK